MIATTRRLIAVPLLLAAGFASANFRQPDSAASAFDAGTGGAGATGAIYIAPVIGSVGSYRAPVVGSGTPVVAGQAIAGPEGNAYAPIDGGIAPAQGPLPAPIHAEGFDLRGAPSISVALIDRVLTDYGSPMAGEGRDLYRLGVKYRIDPAFALAFFVHESATGTRGEAVITHSLGNIRAVPGAPSRDGYRYYDSWLEGAEHWYRLIKDLYVDQWKLTTVASIIPVYAPSGDNNDPTAYIDDVQQLVSAWRAQS